MYICLCKGITDHQIKACLQEGATNLKQVRQRLGVASECGKCACDAQEIIKEHSAITKTNYEPQTAVPLFYCAEMALSS